MTCSYRAASARLQLSAAVPHSLWVTRARLMAQPGHSFVRPGWLQLGAQQLPVRHSNCRLGSLPRHSTFVDGRGGLLRRLRVERNFHLAATNKCLARSDKSEYG